jgi:hypothetical protein
MVNVQKSEVFPIQCSEINVPDILGNFQARQGHLPCWYLGLPLKLGRLTRQNEQGLVDRVAASLSGWKGRLLTKTGHLTLVNSVLSSIVIYHMSVFQLSKWAIRRIDKIWRNFLWRGTEEARGGHCLVSWKRVQRPKALGGLGVLDLMKFNRAMCLRWQWQQRTTPEKPCSGLPLEFSEIDAALFRACTTITLGNGKSTKF